MATNRTRRAAGALARLLTEASPRLELTDADLIDAADSAFAKLKAHKRSVARLVGLLDVMGNLQTAGRGTKTDEKLIRAALLKAEIRLEKAK